MNWKKNGLLTIVCVLALALAGCSGLSGLMGTTGTTASNPTGSAAPALATATVLEISVPTHSTVAANCAAGDTNSCTQQTNITTFCKATATIQEALKSCVSAGWPTS